MVHFDVQLDYETSERAGAGGMFQVISIEDEGGKDCTTLVNQCIHFHGLGDLKQALAEKLGKHPSEISLSEV